MAQFRTVALSTSASIAALVLAPAARAQTTTPVPMPSIGNGGDQQASPSTPDQAGSSPDGSSAAAGGAATQPAVGLEDIVVTAQRRSENLQNVPVAITALTPKMLATAGISSTSDLKALTPGLNFNTNLGGFGQPRIRGIGTKATGPGIENPVATYVDGVYIGTFAGALFSLIDVDQVAILKGPQGTLFGRNATGGLIQVTTRAPSSTPEAEVQVGYANYDTVNANLFLSGRLTDTLAVSVAGLYENQNDGYGVNLYNGLDVQTHRTVAARAKLQWKPDADTKVTLSGDYNKYEGADPALRTRGLRLDGTPSPGGRYDLDLDVQPAVSSRQYGTSLTVQHDFSTVQVLSITAYRNSLFSANFDADQLPVPGLAIDVTQRDKQVSQELQIQSMARGRFRWVAGAYYFHSVGEYDPISSSGLFLAAPFFPLQRVDGYNKQRLDSYAGYVQGTYTLGTATNITAGLRYTSDHRVSDAQEILTIGGATVPNTPYAADRTFNKLTWRLAVDHRFSPELLAYASYNRGFKGGSFAPDTFPIRALEPETLDAYEVGLKSDLFDRRVRLNVAAYYYDQQNLQVNQIISGILTIYNASGARSYGVDADLQTRITDRLTFTAGGSYVHARYKSFTNAFSLFPLPTGGNSFSQNGDATGNRLQDTPDFTVNAGATYDIPSPIGKFTLATNYYHNSGFYADPQNRLRQRPYNLVDASISWFSKDDHLTVRVWAKNINNAFYATQLDALNVGDNQVAAPPRTFGVTAGYKF